MVLKLMDYVFKMSIFKKLSIVLYSVHWYCRYQDFSLLGIFVPRSESSQ